MPRTMNVPHALAEDADGAEVQVERDATDTRSGAKDRDVFVVLMISTVLAVIALLGALAYYSGALSGFGNQTRSPDSFDHPTASSTVAPAAQLPTDQNTPVK